MELYIYAPIVVKMQNMASIFNYHLYLIVKLVIIFRLPYVCDNVMMDIVVYRHAMVLGVA